MSSCQQTESIGTLELVDQDSVAFDFVIKSQEWPSRLVMFETASQGNQGLPAYDEPVYKSQLRVSVTNTGSSTFLCSMGKEIEKSVPPSQIHTFTPVAFEQFRLTIVPGDGMAADVKMKIDFDRNYISKGSWKLVGKWSDGP